MKHLTTAALIAAALLAAPVAYADRDPHKPDLGAHYCPGGGTVDGASPEPSCDGVPYENGAYWRAIQRVGGGGMAAVVYEQCVMPPPPPGLFGPALQGPVAAPSGSCG